MIGLGEVLDYVSTVQADPQLVEKLKLFFNRPNDVHAPLLTGRDLNAYCIAGPRTDHECSNFAELKEKLRNGMAILIRIGSAAAVTDKKTGAHISLSCEIDPPEEKRDEK